MKKFFFQRRIMRLWHNTQYVATNSYNKCEAPQICILVQDTINIYQEQGTTKGLSLGTRQRGVPRDYGNSVERSATRTTRTTKTSDYLEWSATRTTTIGDSSGCCATTTTGDSQECKYHNKNYRRIRVEGHMGHHKWILVGVEGQPLKGERQPEMNTNQGGPHWRANSSNRSGK